MYALRSSESNFGRGEAALERGGGGERRPDVFAMVLECYEIANKARTEGKKRKAVEIVRYDEDALSCLSAVWNIFIADHVLSQLARFLQVTAVARVRLGFLLPNVLHIVPG